jgi:hypothetical protein
MSSPVVVYEATVLLSSPLRDLLLRLACFTEPVRTTRQFQAKWTDKILDDCFDAIGKAHPTAPPEQLQRMREQIVASVPDSIITGYEPLIECLELPDPSCRHVLAAAIRAGAQTIVTSRLSAFPRRALGPYEIRALPPDHFLSDLVQDIGEPVLDVCHQLAGDYASPPLSFSELLRVLERQGLSRAVMELRALSGEVGATGSSLP